MHVVVKQHKGGILYSEFPVTHGTLISVVAVWKDYSQSGHDSLLDQQKGGRMAIGDGKLVGGNMHHICLLYWTYHRFLAWCSLILDNVMELTTVRMF